MSVIFSLSISFTIHQEFLDVDDICRLEIAIGLKQRKMFMKCCNSINLIKRANILYDKNDDKCCKCIDWCFNKTNKRSFTVLGKSTRTKGTFASKDRFGTIEIISDEIKFILYFDGLRNKVEFSLGVSFKEGVMKIGKGIIFDPKSVDTIYLAIAAETTSEESNMIPLPTIGNISFPMVDGKRFLHFKSSDEFEDTFFIDIAESRKSVLTNLKHLKKCFDDILDPLRRDQWD